MISRFRRLFSKPSSPTDRKGLVGMYLSRNNERKGKASFFKTNQERQDGKFSQNRRRS